MIAAWNQSTLDLMSDFLSAQQCRQRRFLLKAAYCNLRHGHQAGGSLEQVLELEGIEVPTSSSLGRAGARLSRAVAMARFLAAQAEG